MMPQLDPSEILLRLIKASERSRSEIPDENLFRDIGFEGKNPRLGWVIPPTWEIIEEFLNRFLNLKLVKGKTNFIFSGMGGWINSIKAITVVHARALSESYYQRLIRWKGLLSLVSLNRGLHWRRGTSLRR